MTIISQDIYNLVICFFRIRQSKVIFVCIFLDPKVQKGETKQIDIGTENVKPKGKAPNRKIRFRCDFPNCDKSFKGKSSLKIHVQSVHEGISYKCDVCYKSFAQKGNLKIHKFVHKIQKAKFVHKFKCQYLNCNESFANLSGLSSHFKSVHEGFSKQKR